MHIDLMAPEEMIQTLERRIIRRECSFSVSVRLLAWKRDPVELVEPSDRMSTTMFDGRVRTLDRTPDAGGRQGG